MTDFSICRCFRDLAFDTPSDERTDSTGNRMVLHAWDCFEYHMADEAGCGCRAFPLEIPHPQIPSEYRYLTLKILRFARP